ncbi:hypothetical protein ACFXTN_008338 [Malus domestica]
MIRSLITTKVILLPMLPDSISIPRILILRLGIPKTLEISPDRKRLLLVVQDCLSSLASQDNDVLLRGEVTKATKVVVDDSKLRDVLITYHYKMLRIIRT